MTDLRTLRVFISSPGDVGEERVILKQTLARLKQAFSTVINIEPFMWEHEALFATADFQSQIDSRLQPRDADIAVFVLWSRLGTALPRSITRDDGSRYGSGTEYEFENAKAGYEAKGQPKILVYRKLTTPVVELSDTDALVERIEQQKRLGDFFKRHFHDAEDNSLTGAFAGFRDSSEFEELVDLHLSSLIRQQLGEEALAELGALRHWEGSPYRGLEHFGPEHADIFFGRTRQVTEVIGLLKRRAKDNNPFVMLLGMSGVGKSSLVNAGIAPMLEEPDVVEGVEHWRQVRFKPSDHPSDPFLGLVTALCQTNALGVFSEPSLLCQEMRLDPDGFGEHVRRQLGKLEENTHCLLFIDQFEELFTQDIEEAEQRAFTEAIRALVQIAGIWTLCAMRSDSFPRVQYLPAMVSLRADGGDKDLLPPAPSELQQIIRLPAQLAGLRFEADAEGTSLDQLLADQAIELPEGLPLLEFTLEQLYKARTEDGVLTYAAYESLGGLSGSIANKAEEVVSSLPSAVRDELPSLLIKMVSVDPQSGTAHRKPVAVGSLKDDPNLQAMVRELISARLIVSQLDAGGEPIINLVHESLLRNWPRVQMFVANEREFLVARAQLEQAAAFWRSEDEPENLLLRDASVLQRALQIKVNYGANLDGNTIRFIMQSEVAFREREESARIEASSRRRRLRLFSGAAGVVTLIVLATAWYSYDASKAVVRAELEDAERRLTSKATSFARLSNAYRDRGDWLNALLLSLDAARIVTNAEHLSLLYDNLIHYNKLDVNRLTFTTSQGDALFGDSIDGGMIFRDRAGFQAYLHGMESFVLQAGDRFWVSLESKFVVIHRVNGGFDLLQTSTGDLVADFSMLAGSVVDVHVNARRDEVLLTRGSGNQALIQLATLQRLELPGNMDVVEWQTLDGGSAVLLQNRNRQLTLYNRTTETQQLLASNVDRFERHGNLVLIEAGGSQEVLNIPTGTVVYRTTNSSETLLLAGQQVASLWEDTRIALINPENPGTPLIVEGEFQQVWPLREGGLLIIDQASSLAYIRPDGTRDPLPVVGHLSLLENSQVLALVDADNVTWVLDRVDRQLLHRIEPPADDVVPRLESGFLLFDEPGRLHLIDVNNPAKRTLVDNLSPNTPYLLRAGYLLLVNTEQVIKQMRLADLVIEKSFAHHNQITDISFDPARGIVFGIDEFGFQHVWESTQAALVEHTPPGTTMLEVLTDDYIGYFQGNQIELRNRFNSQLVLQKAMDAPVSAGTMLPAGMGLVVAVDGRIERIDARGRITTLYAHRGKVGYLKVVGHHLYSGGADGFARVFDLSAGRLLHEIPHWDEVTRVAPIGADRIASGTVRGHLQLYDTHQQRLSGFRDLKAELLDLSELDGDVVVALKEDDGRTALMRDEITHELVARLPAGTLDGKYALISLDQSRAFIATLAEPLNVVEGIQHVFKGFLTHIHVVDLNLNQILRSREFILPPSHATFLDTSGNWLVDGSFSPDAASIVFVTTSGEQFLWHFEDSDGPEPIWTQKLAGDRPWSRAVQVDFTQSGNALVARLSTRDQVAFDASNGKPLPAVPAERLVVGQRMRPVDVTPTKRTRVLRLGTGGAVTELFSLDRDLPFLKLDARQRVLFQQDSNTLVMWDLVNNQQVMAMNSGATIDRVFWPGEGRYLITAGSAAAGTVLEIPSKSLIEYGERLALGGY